MLTMYDGVKAHLWSGNSDASITVLHHALWLDLHQPSSEEVRWVEQQLSVDIPTPDDMREIETTSRLYQEDSALFMTATLIHQADTEVPRSTPVTFILIGSKVITLRYADPSPFRRMVHVCEKTPSVLHEPVRFLTEILDAIVDRLADLLERASNQLEDASAKIFTSDKKERREDHYFQNQLINLGKHADLIGRIRESVTSLSRLSHYLLDSERVQSTEQKERINNLRADLLSIADQANFINGKIQFMLDAVLGLVSIEQNRIIKALSVAATVFLPPTLIASIYGMNFERMPELSWPWGYPVAVGLMLMSAALPYIWLRKRAWI